MNRIARACESKLGGFAGCFTSWLASMRPSGGLYLCHTAHAKSLFLPRLWMTSSPPYSPFSRTANRGQVRLWLLLLGPASARCSERLIRSWPLTKYSRLVARGLVVGL